MLIPAMADHSRGYVSSRDYQERVYAGVLGKIIGVYLGRPFEQWSHARIVRELGAVHYYVHERLGQPLIVTDDDISGTFTFLRALTENGCDPGLTPAQIGDWWLNTIIEGRTILWWGGLGLSTEHTAFLRLKAGIPAPDSGSVARNGRAVAEEIGSQIFIDGWGMVCPGEPERAAEFARRAASVSHDGEAIYGAQVVAALVALAFVERDLGRMLDRAAALLPAGSLIQRLIGDMRVWAAEHGEDWRATLARIHEKYPYERFGTNCPMVSNHAVVLLALLHGAGDFARALMIACTAGYDTDCNAGNVGCILAVMGGLAALDSGPDWRGPVADRLYLPTADGGRAITDAVRESIEVINAGRALAGAPPLRPKGGARFHFSLPGSVQGFRAEADAPSGSVVTVGHDAGRLALHLSPLAAGDAARAGTATFTPPDSLAMGGYALVASPTLYPGQTITARLEVGSALSPSVQVCPYVKVYDANDTLRIRRGPTQVLRSGEQVVLSWVVPDTGGQPVAEVGVEATAAGEVCGPLFLDWLTWTGAPDVTLGRPEGGGKAWGRAWVNGADQFDAGGASAGMVYRVIQNRGVGLISQGESSWTEYEASTRVRTHLAERIGLAACVRGLRRYVALVLDTDGRVRLIRQHDGARTVLAESVAVWGLEQEWDLSLAVTGTAVTARVGDVLLSAPADGLPLSGAVGLLVEEGHAEFAAVCVRPQV